LIGFGKRLKPVEIRLRSYIRREFDNVNVNVNVSDLSTRQVL